MGIIFYLSSHPTPEFVDRYDFQILFIKFAHLVEYGILGFLVYYALRRTTKLRRRDAILFSSFFAGGYGVTDEMHQSFTPGRSAMVWDVFADVIGGGAGGLFGYLVSRSMGVRFSRKA